ncbi:MAG: hypothetical protein HYZ08_00200 [Candidatus Kerfeldbacteria bacterium]|nr:hypothetical protein [Candidatus Kerfeldbacteria bacterium]
MKPYIHKHLAQGRWFQLSLPEQLGNVGSDVDRALRWRREKNIKEQDRALERVLELLELTIADPRWRTRLKELTRTREVLLDYFYGDNDYHSTPEGLSNYFLQFAILARNR